MNIIRTTVVELTSIPAIAYKQKLLKGGSGIKILRLDMDANAIFTLDKRGGNPVPFSNKVDENLFPISAIEEAVELTEGLPYSSRGKIKVSVFETIKEDEDVDIEVDEKEAIDMVDSDEYLAIIDRYSDEFGKINYQLLNKNFIQFANKSKLVMDLINNNASEEDILIHIIKNRAAYLANLKTTITDEEALAIIETLDEIGTRGAFKELKNHLRRMARK